MSDIVTIEIRRCSFLIYPFKLSKWNKELGKLDGTCPQLDRVFKNVEQFRGKYTYKLNLRIYNKETKTLSLPSGVGLDFIEKKLESSGLLYNVIDNSNYVIPPRETDLFLDQNLSILDKFQAQGIDFLTTKELFHSRLLALYTGRGKTFCAISAAYRLKMTTLIISPTLSLQWRDKIELYTNCTVKNKGIKMINGVSTLEALMNKSSESIRSVFYITTPRTLTGWIDKYGTLNNVGEKLGIGIKIFDEVHMHYSQNVYVDMNMDTLFTFYLTATPDRSDFKEKHIFKALFNKIPVYGLQTFSIDNYFNVRLIDYDTKPTLVDVQSCLTSKGLSPILYWNYIFRSEKRKYYMIGMVKILIDQLLRNDPKSKILIFLAKKEHIIEFRKIIEKMYRGSSLKVGDYSTNVKNKQEKFAEINKNIIFTTIQSGGVGLDAKGLTASFSLVPFSSNIIASQMMGRLREIKGREVYHYDFIDVGFKQMEYQRSKRMNVFRVKAKQIQRKFISIDKVLEYLK